MQALTNLYRSVESTFYYTKENLPGYLEEPIEKGDLDAIRSLCSRGIDLKGLTIEGQSLTEFAYHHCDENRDVVLTILLEKGADATTGDGTLIPLLDLQGLKDVSEISTEELQAYFDFVQLFENAGVDVTSCLNPVLDEKRQTLLHLIAYWGNLEAVELLVPLLIQKGESLDPQDEKGQTPLDIAIFWTSIYQKSDEAARILIENGASVETKDAGGQTALHEAASRGSAETVRLLLQKGAALEEKDNEGRTPLFVAARDKNIAGMEPLLEAGASTETKDKKGHSIVEAARSNWISNPFEVDQALLALYLWGHEKAKDYRSSKDFLHIAARAKCTWMLKKLLEQDATKVNDLDSLGTTPLIKAISARRYPSEEEIPVLLEKVQALLDAGADPNKPDSKGQTPLQHVCALKSDCKELAKLLIDRGASLDNSDENGRSLLHIALSHDNGNAYEALIAGADVNARDFDGKTPLHECKNGAGAKALLDAGADVNARDTDGRTPLHYWAEKNVGHDLDILFLQKNLLIDPVDDFEMTPLHLAAMQGEKSAAMQYLIHGAKPDAQLKELLVEKFGKKILSYLT